LETQQAFVDGAPGGDEYQQLADSCDQWLSLGLVDDAAAAWEGTTVIHTPLLAAQLAAGTLILPTPFPVAAGDGPRVPRHGALHPRITARSWRSCSMPAMPTRSTGRAARQQRLCVA